MKRIIVYACRRFAVRHKYVARNSSNNYTEKEEIQMPNHEMLSKGRPNEGQKHRLFGTCSTMCSRRRCEKSNSPVDYNTPYARPTRMNEIRTSVRTIKSRRAVILLRSDTLLRGARRATRGRRRRLTDIREGTVTRGATSAWLSVHLQDYTATTSCWLLSIVSCL